MHNVRYEHSHENTIKSGLFHVDNNVQSEKFTAPLFFNVFWICLRILVIEPLLLVYKPNRFDTFHKSTMGFKICPNLGLPGISCSSTEYWPVIVSCLFSEPSLTLISCSSLSFSLIWSSFFCSSSSTERSLQGDMLVQRMVQGTSADNWTRG